MLPPLQPSALTAEFAYGKLQPKKSLAFGIKRIYRQFETPSNAPAKTVTPRGRVAQRVESTYLDRRCSVFV